jgi:FkbM family methyltransferase
VPNPLIRLASWSARVLPMGLKQAFYRVGPVAAIIRSVLNRAAPTGLNEITVAGGELAGERLYLDLQAEKDYWLGTYEAELQAAVREWVQQGWVAYDVGANIGYVSIMLAKAVGPSGQVYAFEALPANLERLRTHLALNDLTEQVQVIAAAVVDQYQPVHFLVGPSGGMGKAEGSAGRRVEYIDKIDVPGVSLDDFVYQQGNPQPQIIKMDIEGGEVLALKGMSRMMAEARPLIFLELHGPEAGQVSWDILSKFGYDILRMDKEYPLIPSLDVLDWKAYVVARPGG